MRLLNPAVLMLAALVLGLPACAGPDEETAGPVDVEDQEDDVVQDGTGPEPAATEEPEFTCVDPDPTLVEGIASGLTVNGGGELGVAKAVTVASERRNDRGWPEQLVAAEIKGEGMDGIVGTWATAESGGPIMAVDTMAREFSDWGAAAQPGSEAEQVIDTIAGYPEVRAAQDCAERSE